MGEPPECISKIYKEAIDKMLAQETSIFDAHIKAIEEACLTGRSMIRVSFGEDDMGFLVKHVPEEELKNE